MSHPAEGRAAPQRETARERAQRKVLHADGESETAKNADGLKNADAFSRTPRRVHHRDEEPVAHHAISHGRSRRLAQLDESADVEAVEGAEVGEAARLRTPQLRHRARRRIRATTLVFVLGAGVFSLSLGAMTHVVWSEYRLYQGEVERREATLRDLQQQLETGQKRLAVLQSPKGREQLLIEHGYIRPGDRILLFPPTPEERRQAAVPKNDLSPRPVEHIDEGARSSAWRRAGDTLRGWWQNFNAPTPKIAHENRPSEPAGSDATASP